MWSVSPGVPRTADYALLILETNASAARRYVKFGFGGAHTESNQRLMYTSA